MTSSGAVNACCPAVNDVPALLAPSAGTPGTQRAFQQQLRDAHDSLSYQGNQASAGSTGRPSRAAVRAAHAGNTENAKTDKEKAEKSKQDPRDGNTDVAAPMLVAAASTPTLPLTFGLPLLPDTNDGTASTTPTAGLPAQDTNPHTEPAPDSTPPPTAALQGELTFAVKLDPKATAEPAADGKDDAPDQSKLTQATVSAPAGGPSKAAATVITPVKETHRPEMESEPQPPPDNLAKAVTAFQAPEKSAPDHPQPVEQPRVEPAAQALDAAPVQAANVEHTAKAGGSLKDLSIQVGQTQSDRVQLRVVERSGELQVAVRAANPDLAQGLRQGLSDLADRLEQNGFRAETWRPGATVSSVQGTAETRHTGPEFHNDSSQSQSGGSQQGRQQNNQQQSNRPRWVQELEGSLAGGTSHVGESYGISR